MQVKDGDRVRVHYTLKNTDGNVLESSRNQVPVDFIIGAGNMIRGFEKGVIGMKVNDTKTISVPTDDAYGPRDEDKTFEFGRENVPKDFEPQIGQMVQLAKWHRGENWETLSIPVGGSEAFNEKYWGKAASRGPIR